MGLISQLVRNYDTAIHSGAEIYVPESVVVKVKAHPEAIRHELSA